MSEENHSTPPVRGTGDEDDGGLWEIPADPTSPGLEGLVGRKLTAQDLALLRGAPSPQVQSRLREMNVPVRWEVLKLSTG